jgi:ABC-type multidrug transport system fused ATPase/permease subunit
VVQYGLHYQYFDYLFRYKLQNEFSYRFCRKLTELDVSHLEDSDVQTLITKVRETHQWRMPDFMRVLAYVFTAIIGALASAVAIATFGWWIVLVVIASVIPRFLVRVKLGWMQWSMYGSGAPEARKLWYFGWLLSEPNSLREIKIFQTGPALLKRFAQIQERIFRLGKKPLDRFIKFGVTLPVLEGVVLVALAYTQLSRVSTGLMSIGTFTLFINMLTQLASSVASVGTNFGELYEDGLFVGMFMDLTSIENVIKNDPAAVSFDVSPPRIEFRNVGFTYPTGKVALRDVSFVIEPAESVALVGPNGAGKTTIVKLLCRFYDVSSGQILINGVDIRKVDLDNWYRHLGTLFQDFVTYRLSVRDNILLGDPQRIDEKAMALAAEKAGAREFIEELPKGYDQILGNDFEDGEQLSGGQWQKLAIARAFYQKAPVLILDEPTSAIDAEAEFAIFNQLEREYRDKTLILVSHRFSTVRNANRIVVLEDGTITESGTHDELLLRKGRYYAMFTTQAAGYQ